MSESSSPRQAEAPEPSMEDILASIRRILAEDAPPGEQPAADDGKPAAQEQPAYAGDFELPGQDIGRRDELTQWEVPEQNDFDADPPEPAAAAPEPEALTADVPPPLAHDDVFVLQPTMRSGRHTLVSDEPAADSTDVLSQLARAILDRRDIAVATRDVTLEGMVRGMLRPLLHEWLDRNLPYLIERLVKKEIDLMINRAERLED